MNVAGNAANNAIESEAGAVWRTTSLDEVGVAANMFLERACASEERATVVALHGDLGAGKTTFVQHIAAAMGVIEQVTSPTFVLMKSYAAHRTEFKELVHIDAYRIESVEEVAPLRLRDVFARPRALVCIEWAERITEVLPASTIHLTLRNEGAGTHTITYAG